MDIKQCENLRIVLSKFIYDHVYFLTCMSQDWCTGNPVIYSISISLPIIMCPLICIRPTDTKGHFTHESESPWPLHFKHSHWWKRWAGPSTLHTMLEGPTKYMNARWMWSLHGFLHGIKWIVFRDHLDNFKNHLLEVGLTQKRKTMALWFLTTVDLFCFIMCEDLHK